MAKKDNKTEQDNPIVDNSGAVGSLVAETSGKGTENNGGEMPADSQNPANEISSNTGKKRIKNENMNNKSVFVFDGSLISFNKDGIAEVDEQYADYLLKIPSYTEE